MAGWTLSCVPTPGMGQCARPAHPTPPSCCRWCARRPGAQLSGRPRRCAGGGQRSKLCSSSAVFAVAVAGAGRRALPLLGSGTGGLRACGSIIVGIWQIACIGTAFLQLLAWLAWRGTEA